VHLHLNGVAGHGAERWFGAGGGGWSEVVHKKNMKRFKVQSSPKKRMSLQSRQSLPAQNSPLKRLKGVFGFLKKQTFRKLSTFGKLSVVQQ
jgi:hypothetical protein